MKCWRVCDKEVETLPALWGRLAAQCHLVFVVPSACQMFSMRYAMTPVECVPDLEVKRMVL